MGADRLNIIVLSLIESMIINFAALLLAVIMFFMPSGLFNRMISTPIADGYINYSRVALMTILIIVAGIFITSVIAAVPAISEPSPDATEKNVKEQWFHVARCHSVFLVLFSSDLFLD